MDSDFGLSLEGQSEGLKSLAKNKTGDGCMHSTADAGRSKQNTLLQQRMCHTHLRIPAPYVATITIATAKLMQMRAQVRFTCG